MSGDLVQRLRELAAGKHDDKEFALDAAEKIEALEGEVRRVNDLLVDAHQHANKWMKERDKESARAERLRVALERLKGHPSIGVIVFTEQYVTELGVRITSATQIIDKALEDDKPIRAAAGEEGK